MIEIGLSHYLVLGAIIFSLGMILNLNFGQYERSDYGLILYDNEPIKHVKFIFIYDF